MQLKGNPASEGIAVGEVLLYAPRVYEGKEAYFEGDASPHLAVFQEAMASSLAELDALIAGFPPEKQERAMIFAAHQEQLEDKEIVAGIREMIEEEHAIF